ANSTVATVTEVAHYLRLLYAKLGTPHCPEHQLPVRNHTASELLELVRATPGKFDIFAPAIEARKGLYLDLFTAAARSGISTAIVDGQRVDTDDPPLLNRQKEHDILLLVCAAVDAGSIGLSELEKALRWGKGS